MKKYVTVSLSFDVQFPVDAKTDEEAEEIADDMHLSDFLDWASCSSYTMNVLTVEDGT